eukprot:237653-Rhodomonas_salina.2
MTSRSRPSATHRFNRTTSSDPSLHADAAADASVCSAADAASSALPSPATPSLELHWSTTAATVVRLRRRNLAASARALEAWAWARGADPRSAAYSSASAHCTAQRVALCPEISAIASTSRACFSACRTFPRTSSAAGPRLSATTAPCSPLTSVGAQSRRRLALSHSLRIAARHASSSARRFVRNKVGASEHRPTIAMSRRCRAMPAARTRRAMRSAGAKQRSACMLAEMPARQWTARRLSRGSRSEAGGTSCRTALNAAMDSEEPGP